MQNQKRLNEYLPIAVDVVEDIFIAKNGAVPSEYDSALSRFGVAVRQMGLRAAVTACNAKTSDAKANKKIISRAICRIISVHKEGVCTDANTLLDLIEKESDTPIMRRKVIDAATALKLALRLHIVKPSKDDDNGYEED